MNKKNILLPLFIICSAIIFFIKKKYNNKTPNIKGDTFKYKSDIKINKFQLNQILKNNNTKFVLDAKTGHFFKKKNIAKCKETKVTIISDNKKIATLYAPKTIFNLKKNKVKLKGGVQSLISNNIN